MCRQPQLEVTGRGDGAGQAYPPLPGPWGCSVSAHLFLLQEGNKCTRVDTSPQICVHIRMHTHISTHRHTHTHTPTHMYVSTCTRSCEYTCTHTCTYTPHCAHIHMYVHTHKHVFTRVFPAWLLIHVISIFSPTLGLN